MFHKFARLKFLRRNVKRFYDTCLNFRNLTSEFKPQFRYFCFFVIASIVIIGVMSFYLFDENFNLNLYIGFLFTLGCMFFYLIGSMLNLIKSKDLLDNKISYIINSNKNFDDIITAGYELINKTYYSNEGFSYLRLVDRLKYVKECKLNEEEKRGELIINFIKFFLYMLGGYSFLQTYFHSTYIFCFFSFLILIGSSFFYFPHYHSPSIFKQDDIKQHARSVLYTYEIDVLNNLIKIKDANILSELKK